MMYSQQLSTVNCQLIAGGVGGVFGSDLSDR